MIPYTNRGIFASIALVALTVLAGCESLPPKFTNNVCPPQTAAIPTGVAYASGVQPVPQGNYSPMHQPMAPQTGYGMQPGQGMDFYNQQPAAMPAPAGYAQQQASTMETMAEMGSKLKQAHEENASLRANLAQLQAENQRYGEVATKATQLASRVRDDNQKLDSELSKWRTELEGVETIVREQKAEHETSLSEIEGQLDDLLSEYEAEVISRSALN